MIVYQNILLFKSKSNSCILFPTLRHNEKLMKTPNNPISLAISLNSFRDGTPTMLGSMLFSRFVSGTRVGVPSTQKLVCGIMFDGYGTHIDSYPCPYLNVACAIGITKMDINTFIDRLEKTWIALLKTKNKKDFDVLPKELESNVKLNENEVLQD